MNPSMAKRIVEAHTFVVAASTNKLVADTVENRVVVRCAAVDIEREVVSRERMKLFRRMAVR